ncbi:unnamed protein product [Schistosoma margrebowiei]|uniref:Reverse transcriptase domain-containing protein n=1 Tax=Schistosoma margrebowiei TaxID=48269 RepID=A0A3P8DZK3_9TREM|nr:unnamed protein product [Schistosoma margrebowiei]
MQEKEKWNSVTIQRGKLAGKYSKPERPVKDKEGKPITKIQQQRNRRLEYFEEILNRPALMNPPDIEAAHTDLPMDANPPTTEEIRMAIRKIKCGKAAGPDNIPMVHLHSSILWEKMAYEPIVGHRLPWDCISSLCSTAS